MQNLYLRGCFNLNLLTHAEDYRTEVDFKISNGTYPRDKNQLPIGIYMKKSKTQALPYLVSDGIKKDENTRRSY